MHGIFCDYISQMTSGTKRSPHPLSATSVFTVGSSLQCFVLGDDDAFVQDWTYFFLLFLHRVHREILKMLLSVTFSENSFKALYF